MWGTDNGNVCYATAWANVLEAGDAHGMTIKYITGFESSGNVVELLFGLMYLADMMPEMSAAEFYAHCAEKELSWAKHDCWEPTYKFLVDNVAVLKKLVLWRSALEAYVCAFQKLLEHSAFTRWTTNATWDVKKILSAVDCLRMGWPAQPDLLDAFYRHPLPPPAATLSAAKLAYYWSLS